MGIYDGRRNAPLWFHVVSVTTEEILERVLVAEGWPRYTEHPNDRGGPTKGGVTLRTLEAWRGRRCTRAELKRLKKDEALLIFKRQYAEQNGIQKFDGHIIQPQLVDNAILSGPQTAVRDLQHVVGVAADGIIGPITIAAVNDYGEEIVPHLAVQRAKRLGEIVVNNRRAFMRQLRTAVESGDMTEVAAVLADDQDQTDFLNGWLNRALSFV